MVALPVSTRGFDALSRFVHAAYARDADGRTAVVSGDGALHRITFGANGTRTTVDYKSTVFGTTDIVGGEKHSLTVLVDNRHEEYQQLVPAANYRKQRTGLAAAQRLEVRVEERVGVRGPPGPQAVEREQRVHGLVGAKRESVRLKTRCVVSRSGCPSSSTFSSSSC